MTDYRNFQDTLKQLMKNSALNNELGLQVEHYDFKSEIEVDFQREGVLKGDIYYHELVDNDSPENFNFPYSIIKPAGNKKYNRGILLLHGLNEKTWDKYYAWAGKLALEMEQPVILFPIAYHMNRAPKSWSDPRAMKNVVQSRLKFYKKNESTFANAALSTRLGANPELFIYSGIQSYYDVRQLMTQINNGEHPLFKAGVGLDIFAYSIGAFLSEILFVSNPDNMLKHSRMFLFAGGPTFESMVGNSRYIMDIKAYKSLLRLRRRKFQRKIYRNLQPQDLPDFENTWNGLMAMFSYKRGKKLREKVLQDRGAQIYAVALEKDKVMPERTIVKTLRGNKNKLPVTVDVIDFPYNYTHENPFPVNDEKLLPLVNRSFDVVMNKSLRFFNSPIVVPEITLNNTCKIATQTI